jgi:hypothetical protein
VSPCLSLSYIYLKLVEAQFIIKWYCIDLKAMILILDLCKARVFWFCFGCWYRCRYIFTLMTLFYQSDSVALAFDNMQWINQYPLNREVYRCILHKENFQYLLDFVGCRRGICSSDQDDIWWNWGETAVFQRY